MHIIHTVLATLAFASVAMAILVPNTLTDGHWSGSVNKTTGEVIWNKIKELSPRHTTPRPIGGGAARALSVRGIATADAPSVNKRDQTGCTLHSINPSVAASLYDWAVYDCNNDDMWVAGGAFQVIVSGGFFFYACNYRSDAYSPPASDIVITEDSVNYRCTEDGTGWDHLDSDNFTFGLEVVGYEVCGNL